MPPLGKGKKWKRQNTLCVYLLNIYTAPTAPREFSLSTIRYFPNIIIATWTPPIPKNGIITAYSVYCNTSVNGLIIRAKTNATTLVVTINTGSVMFTQYSCYVTANTSIGEGTPSQMITIESREHIEFVIAVSRIFHIAIYSFEIYTKGPFRHPDISVKAVNQHGGRVFCDTDVY